MAAEISRDEATLRHIVDDHFVFNANDGKTSGKTELIQTVLGWKMTGRTITGRTVLVDGDPEENWYGCGVSPLSVPEQKAMNHFLSILKLNTRLYLNCLEGVSPAIAWHRPDQHTNSLGFIALHLVDARYYLGEYLGLEIHNPYKEALAHVRGIDDLPEQHYPTIDHLRAQWLSVSEVLTRALPQVKRGDLAAASVQPFPVEDTSKYGGVQFLLHHESYHIGQLSLLRRQAGLPAMQYR